MTYVTKRTATPGVVRVDAATAERANRFMEREDLLDQAIHDGRISAGLRGHYAACFDADPAGTQEFLAKLAVGTTRETETNEVYPSDWLSPTERGRVSAAQEERQHSRFVS